MSIHSFTLLLREAGGADSVSLRLHRAGCDDALVGEDDGVPYAAFTRRGATMEDAVLSARSDVEAAGIAVTGVDAEDGE